MSNLFSGVLNMSMTGSVVILLVMLVRFLLKRSPKIFSYALWSVVLFRLLCPVAFTAPVSVLDVVEPDIREASDHTSMVSYLPDDIGLNVDFVAIPVESQPVQQNATSGSTEQLRMTPMHAVALVWFAGAVGMTLYSVVQYLLLKRKLIGAVQLSGNVYLADNIDTAFVIGVLTPRIYLPSNVPMTERKFILAHEQHHILRFDHVIKLLAYLALCIHWFNPLVWAAFILAGKDMEMSCDEAVIKKLGPEIRADYSASLLRLATHKKILSGMPLAFGEGDTKGRVLNMAKWKKPAKWLIAICAVICLCVLTVCAFNPEEEQSIEDITRRTVNSPVGTGIGDLYFTYPAGLTSEMRDAENWTKEEELRRLLGEPNRSQWVHIFSDNGTVFGGVIDFIVPDDRKVNLREMNLPEEWTGLDYIGGGSVHPYVDMQYTLIKDGRDYIQVYVYTYSGRGYFLWFYTEQGDPANKLAILESVELGNGSQRKTKLERDEEISLGLFNLTIPKGYGYYRNETVILEISKKDLFREYTVVGCVTARPNPNLPMENDEDLVRWVEAIGIDLDESGIYYTVTDDTNYGDIFLSFQDNSQGIPVIQEQHYFFIAGNIVYDLWLDPQIIDEEGVKAILESIWLKESGTASTADKWVTAAGESPVQIGQLPDRYNYGFDKDQNIVFAWGNNAVGGIKVYPIPEDIYDPYDKSFFWLEEMGIPDFEDPSLAYIGGMTSGDNGWIAEFADNVDDDTKRTVYRRHTFKVVGDTLYDIWFDMLNISHDTSQEILYAIQLPQAVLPEEKEKSPEDIAFEKCLNVMDAVADGSSHIISAQESQSDDGLNGYERTFLYHEGDLLYTSTGEHGDRYALLYVGDEFFTSEVYPEGNLWKKTEPVEPDSPWLGNRLWVKSFASYIDTVTDEAGNTVYMWRYDKMYEDSDGYADHYFVNFTFDPDGNFLNVKIQVNLFQDNAFTVTESIVSLDPETVNAKIQKEYHRAIG